MTELTDVLMISLFTVVAVAISDTIFEVRIAANYGEYLWLFKGQINKELT